MWPSRFRPAVPSQLDLDLDLDLCDLDLYLDLAVIYI